MNARFQLDGAHYGTDADTLSVLRSAVDSYRAGGSVDVSAVAAMMHIGIATGRIVPESNDATEQTIDGDALIAGDECDECGAREETWAFDGAELCASCLPVPCVAERSAW